MFGPQTLLQINTPVAEKYTLAATPKSESVKFLVLKFPSLYIRESEYPVGMTSRSAGKAPPDQSAGLWSTVHLTLALYPGRRQSEASEVLVHWLGTDAYEAGLVHESEYTLWLRVRTWKYRRLTGNVGDGLLPVRKDWRWLYPVRWLAGCSYYVCDNVGCGYVLMWSELYRPLGTDYRLSVQTYTGDRGKATAKPVRKSRHWRCSSTWQTCRCAWQLIWPRRVA